MRERKKTRLNLGEDSIGSLLFKQSLPAAIGLMSVIVYQLVDTIFVGNFIGTNAIAAITVVLPITFLISSVGMSLGVGGASVISRAMGADDPDKAYLTFGNLIVLVSILSISAMILGYLFANPVLSLFGAKGEVFPMAYQYYMILLPALPFLAWAMMANNLVRSEGEATIPMIAMIIPGILNILLDALFIMVFGWGIQGAALATMFSYISSGSFLLWYFVSGRSSILFYKENLKLKWDIIKETISIGGTTLARQGTASLLAIVINNTLFVYSGELGIAAYGIVSRVMMFIFFPVFGLVQGSLPIVGFNFGANQYLRVRKTMTMAISWGTFFCFLILLVILGFADPVVRVFTKDPDLIAAGTVALKLVFLASPVIAMQALGAAYFQAIGKALPALLLTLTRQGFFLIPLIFILPKSFGTNGIWYAFPISDTMALIVTVAFLFPQWKKLTNAESHKSIEKGKEESKEESIEENIEESIESKVV